MTQFSLPSLELEDLRQSVLSGRVAAAARRDSLEVRRNSRAEAGALSRSGHVSTSDMRRQSENIRVSTAAHSEQRYWVDTDTKYFESW